MASVLAFCFGCSSSDSARPRPLPDSVMTELSSRSVRPETLGFQTDRVEDQVVWQGPRTGYRVAGTVVSLPFSLEHGWPTISARLNGTLNAAMVVDTGASLTSLDGRTAASARVRTVDTNHFPIQTLRGVGGTERTVLGLVDRLTLGGLDITNMVVDVRLEESPQGGGMFGRTPRLNNLLGLRPVMLGSSYVTIDYPQKKLTISPRAEFRPPLAGLGGRPVLEVPFAVVEQTLRISLGFPNGRRAEFIVDTGYNGELLISTSTTEYAGLDQAVRSGRQGAVRGIGGEMMQIGFTIDWIEMGGRRFGYMKALTGTRHDLIGSGWLRQFRVTFDFRRRVMWLE